MGIVLTDSRTTGLARLVLWFQTHEAHPSRRQIHRKWAEPPRGRCRIWHADAEELGFVLNTL